MAKLKKGFQDVDISTLKKAEWNYKVDDADKALKLKNNIEKNSQIENLIIREVEDGYEVVNGNHRLDVMLELNYKDVHVYNFGNISLNQAKRIAIETNETRFASDNIRLAELFKDMVEEFEPEDLQETMPYDVEEINNFVELTDFDWEKFNKDEKVSDFKEPEKVTFIITCSKNDEMMEQELMDVCEKYGSADLRIK